MHRDILTAVSRHLTPDLMAKMASASGISDPAMTEKAVGAAVPAVLSRLATLATKPERGAAIGRCHRQAVSSDDGELCDHRGSSAALGRRQEPAVVSARRRLLQLPCEWHRQIRRCRRWGGPFHSRHAHAGHSQRARTRSWSRSKWIDAAARISEGRFRRGDARWPVRSSAHRRGPNRVGYVGSKARERASRYADSDGPHGPRRGPDPIQIVAELGVLGLAVFGTSWPGLVFLG